MLERLNRWWRMEATGFCFAVFGLGGLLVRMVIYPVLAVTVHPLQRRTQMVKAVIHHSFRAFVALMAGLGVLSYEVRHVERLQRKGLLVLANHPSLIDVVFLISFIRNMDCIVKQALLRNPFTRGPIAAAGFIANDAGATLVESCIASIHAGNNLIIFPEGTRTPVNGAVQLQRGAANVAVRGRINITPVHIHCTLPMLTKGAPWWKVPLRRPHFTIEVREDIDINALMAGASSEALAARNVTQYLSEQLFKEPSRVRT